MVITYFAQPVFDNASAIRTWNEYHEKAEDILLPRYVELGLTLLSFTKRQGIKNRDLCHTLTSIYGVRTDHANSNRFFIPIRRLRKMQINWADCVDDAITFHAMNSLVEAARLVHSCLLFNVSIRIALEQYKVEKEKPLFEARRLYPKRPLW